mgnify:CR=1 FL=1
METKECAKCKKILPIKSFHKRTLKTGNVSSQSRCKSCQGKERVKYYKPNEKTRQQLRISDAFYEELMKNEHCNICGKELEKKCIDHCHETKKIRGVLCNNCNTALGLFKDNVEVMKDAIRYLEQPKQLQSH